MEYNEKLLTRKSAPTCQLYVHIKTNQVKNINTSTFVSIRLLLCLKVTVTQIEKALINDCLGVLKVLRNFYIPTIYDFAVIYR